MGILAKHPEIVNEIKDQLWVLRTSGLPVNVLVARSIMLAIIKQRQPDLLLTFKYSEVGLFALLTAQITDIGCLEICASFL